MVSSQKFCVIFHENGNSLVMRVLKQGTYHPHTIAYYFLLDFFPLLYIIFIKIWVDMDPLLQKKHTHTHRFSKMRSRHSSFYHYSALYGHESEQILRDSEGQEAR